MGSRMLLRDETVVELSFNLEFYSEMPVVRGGLLTVPNPLGEDVVYYVAVHIS
jgi:hypothetical protein